MGKYTCKQYECDSAFNPAAIGCKDCEFIELKPQATNPPVPQVGSKDLLSRLDALIGTIRTKEYEANKDFEETTNKFFEGHAEAFDTCAILLTDVVKSV